MAKTEALYGTPMVQPDGLGMAELAYRFVMNSVNWLEDPAYDFITFQIDWSDETGLFANEDNRGSALRYLKNIGETERYEQLKKVIAVLRDIFDAKLDGFQYVLQGVVGLSALNDAYDKLAQPVDIQLQCFEDITWRIKGVNAMLSFIMYDPYRQVEVLPRNLRRFSGSFIIADVRDLSDIGIDGKEVKSEDDAKLFIGNEGAQLTTIACPSMFFNLRHVQDDVDNVNLAELRGLLSINVRQCIASSILPALHALQHATDAEKQEAKKKPDTFAQKIAKRAKAFAADKAVKALTVAKNAALNYAMSRAYRFAEQSGAVDKVNKAGKFLKPEVMMAQYMDAAEDFLDDKLGLSVKAAMRATYQPSLQGDTDTTNAGQPQYVESSKLNGDEARQAYRNMLNDKS